MAYLILGAVLIVICIHLAIVAAIDYFQITKEKN